jgi:hypothetical protein
MMFDYSFLAHGMKTAPVEIPLTKHFIRERAKRSNAPNDADA